MNIQLAIAGLALTVSAQASPSGTDWDAIINSNGGADILFGVNLTGPAPYTRNTDLQFPPASTTKLFSSGEALEMLGHEFRFETVLEWRPITENGQERITDLKLIGTGDPTWGMIEFSEHYLSRVDKIVAAMVSEGVKEVHGAIEVVSNDPRWERVKYPHGWLDEDKIECYASQPQAFNIGGNCAGFWVTSAKGGAWQEAGVPTLVKVQLRAGSATSLTVTPVHTDAVDSASFVISGTWKSGTSPQRVWLPIHDVRTWVQNLLVISLKEHGIAWFPTEPRAITYGFRSLSFWSPTMGEILHPFMKKSLNWIGDGIHRYLGQKHGSPSADLVTAGQEVMRLFIANIGKLNSERTGEAFHYGIFLDNVTLWDGSGVSQENRATPSALITVLKDYLHRPGFPQLWESLPIAGVDGTLEKRMRGTLAEGRLRAKTGTLSGVYNLAGYVPRYGTLDGNQQSPPIVEYVPFVMLSKTQKGNGVPARGAQDRVGAKLTELVAQGDGSRN